MGTITGKISTIGMQNRIPKAGQEDKDNCLEDKPTIQCQ